MDFIMRVLANNKAFLLIGLCVWLFSTPVFATEITQAQTSLRGDSYVLSADIDYQLSDTAKEALQHGVPLFWSLHIKVMQQRDIIWNKTVAETVIRYRLQYHALLNMYRVVIIDPAADIYTHREQNGDSYNFSTLSAALDLMATLHNVPIIKQADIAPEHHYFIQIKANFERDALPLPLRPIAYTNPQWYLSSNWTTWDLLPALSTQSKP
jgi:hypothetical protein